MPDHDPGNHDPVHQQQPQSVQEEQVAAVEEGPTQTPQPEAHAQGGAAAADEVAGGLSKTASEGRAGAANGAQETQTVRDTASPAITAGDVAAATSRRNDSEGEDGAPASSVAFKRPAKLKSASVTREFLNRAISPKPALVPLRRSSPAPAPQPANSAPGPLAPAPSSSPAPMQRSRLVTSRTSKPLVISAQTLAQGKIAAGEVWGKNKAPVPKQYTDEELSKNLGIRMAQRLASEVTSKESKWDEMDDDELDFDTIEFGDGTTVTLAPDDPEEEAAAAKSKSSTSDAGSKASGSGNPWKPIERQVQPLDQISGAEAQHHSGRRVGKEERFADDGFDRRWGSGLARPTLYDHEKGRLQEYSAPYGARRRSSHTRPELRAPPDSIGRRMSHGKETVMENGHGRKVSAESGDARNLDGEGSVFTRNRPSSTASSSHSHWQQQRLAARRGSEVAVEDAHPHAQAPAPAPASPVVDIASDQQAEMRRAIEAAKERKRQELIQEEERLKRAKAKADELAVKAAAAAATAHAPAIKKKTPPLASAPDTGKKSFNDWRPSDREKENVWGDLPNGSRFAYIGNGSAESMAKSPSASSPASATMPKASRPHASPKAATAAKWNKFSEELKKLEEQSMTERLAQLQERQRLEKATGGKLHPSQPVVDETWKRSGTSAAARGSGSRRGPKNTQKEDEESRQSRFFPKDDETDSHFNRPFGRAESARVDSVSIDASGLVDSTHKHGRRDNLPEVHQPTTPRIKVSLPASLSKATRNAHESNHTPIVVLEKLTPERPSAGGAPTSPKSDAIGSLFDSPNAINLAMARVKEAMNPRNSQRKDRIPDSARSSRKRPSVLTLSVSEQQEHPKPIISVSQDESVNDLFSLETGDLPVVHISKQDSQSSAPPKQPPRVRRMPDTNTYSHEPVSLFSLTPHRVTPNIFTLPFRLPGMPPDDPKEVLVKRRLRTGPKYIPMELMMSSPRL